MADNNRLGDIGRVLESEAISNFAPLASYIPDSWIKDLVKGISMKCHSMCGSNILMSIVGGIILGVIGLLAYVTIVVLWNGFIKPVVFWGASCMRTFNGVGGEDGKYQNYWFISFYPFMFLFFYKPYAFPLVFSTVSWVQVFRFLKF